MLVYFYVCRIILSVEYVLLFFYFAHRHDICIAIRVWWILIVYCRRWKRSGDDSREIQRRHTYWFLVSSDASYRRHFVHLFRLWRSIETSMRKASECWNLITANYERRKVPQYTIKKKYVDLFSPLLKSSDIILY